MEPLTLAGESPAMHPARSSSPRALRALLLLVACALACALASSAPVADRTARPLPQRSYPSSSSSSSPSRPEGRAPPHSLTPPSSPSSSEEVVDPDPDLDPDMDPDLGPSGAQGIHLLLRPPDLLSPSLPPPLPPHGQPTLTPPPPWDHGPSSLEEAWGSGDYLETLSFMVPDGEELAPATPLPEHRYEDDASDWLSYDTSFPSRPTLPLSSHLPLPPSSSSSSSSSSSPPTRRPGGPDLLPSWEDEEEYDPDDLLPLEPTELLLPDMNSLEYYSNLQARERDERHRELERERHRELERERHRELEREGHRELDERHRELERERDHRTATATATATAAIAPTATQTAAHPSTRTETPPHVDADAPPPPSRPSVPSSEAGPASSPPPPSGHEIPKGPPVEATPPLAVAPTLEGGRDGAPAPALATTPVRTPVTPPPPPPKDPPPRDPPPGRPDEPRPPSNTTSVALLPPGGHPAPPQRPGPAPKAEPDPDTVKPHLVTRFTPTEKPTTTTVGTTTAKPTTTTTTTTASTTAKPVTTTTLRANVISFTRAPAVTTPRVGQTPPTRQYLCNATKPEMYLVRVVSSKGPSSGFNQVRDLLKREFNRSVELQFLRTPSSFAFRAVSGPLIFTAMSVLNALRQGPRGVPGPLPGVQPLYSVPDLRHQVHSVLQFVPGHVDVRLCNFSERVERGLLLAYAETRRRAHEQGNVTVQLLNITMGPRSAGNLKVPVDITFAVRDARGFLTGSEVSQHLRKLSEVEFSFYLGYPALQIAEPFLYPELNTSHHLRSTWVRTVLLGVGDQLLTERSFRARLERRLALLLEEGLGEGARRRWRRSTAVGNSSLQVVRIARLSGPERPLEVLYFVEGPGGARVPAEATAATLNRLDLQRAAIVLGHRMQRPLAQPVETVSVPPSETQSSSVWLIVGVVVPVLLALFIIVILYWKMCGSEKLEFQPDAINTIQQRQKLQAPSVKGFDFAKLHLGQHSKDDIMVIQEPGAAPAPSKEPAPSEGGDPNTPKSKGSSSTKVARSSRRRGRMTPSDGDSLGSDQSSGRESAEESTRPVATPSEVKQHRKTTKNGRNKIAAPSGSGPDELLSSSSIFDHVDRQSRGSGDGTRRQANKVQLIAMQPRHSPPTAAGAAQPPQQPPPQARQHPPAQPSPTLTERVNTEVALRHKSEIEHHRNKLRQRAKRRGQCEFPSMDDILDAFGDAEAQGVAAQRLYSSAHDHMDRMLHHDGASPPSPGESRKRGRRSPRVRRAQPGNGSLPDTDRDRLLTDGNATYRKYPGLNNVAYMSDPDLAPSHGSPSPTDEVFDSALPPPPYMPPQPSIEEARQQMHSLLDDAFALVSPSSLQGSVGVAGISPALPTSPSPQGRPPGRQWGSYPAHSPFSARYAELGMSPSSVQGLMQRQGLGLGGAYVSASEQMQESVYGGRGPYDDPPSSSRPRPVGGSAGAQLHHLTQVGLSSQIGAYPGVGRSVSGPTGSSWNHQHQDHEPPGDSRESVLSFPEFTSSSVFQMPSSSLHDPSSAPPLLLTSPTPEYPPEDASPSAHSSASLIKAIREELRRLAQKQASVSSYP